MSTTRSLYAINEELDLILSVLDGEEFDAESVNAAIDGWLDSSREEIEKKLDDYCAVIADKGAMAKARRAESQILAGMARHDESVADNLKDRAKAFFERIGVAKMETLRFKPRVQANGGVLTVLLSDEVQADPQLLGLRFYKITITPDTDAIRTALEQGETVPGATLDERGTHFRLR